jgi:hypothetical protein
MHGLEYKMIFKAAKNKILIQLWQIIRIFTIFFEIPLMWQAKLFITEILELSFLLLYMVPLMERRLKQITAPTESME